MSGGCKLESSTWTRGITYSVVCMFDAFNAGYTEFLCSESRLAYSIRQGTVDVGP